MSRISRRAFLAASAGVIASPAIGAPAVPIDFDLIIVGAGAAGIAAARRVAAAGRSFALLEAADRVGGRCVTDTKTFGVPYDLGAHWIWSPDSNPLVKLAPKTGLTIDPTSTRLHLRIGRRNARESELEDFLGVLVRANRAIEEAGHGKTDISCADVMPRDLRDWRPTIEFMLGPYRCARDLREVGAFDFVKSVERDRSAFCQQGYGALLAKLAAGVAVRLSTPVTRIEVKERVEVDTEKGRLTARGAIMTCSTNVLLSGDIKFAPELPKRQLDALSALKLGSYDHVALEIAGNVLGTDRDDLVFEKSDSPRTAALLANTSGTSIATVDVAGSFGRELSRKGEQAMIEFAVEWLTGLYGPDVKNAVKRTRATRWSENPLVRGAYSSAGPGRQGMRKILSEPVRDRIWFAGEATHETQWGTVAGAWDSGTRAAEAALKKFGLLREPEEPKAKQLPGQNLPRRRQRG